MLPTPDTPQVPDTVYPPSEDSYLVLDTLADPEQVKFLSQRLSYGPTPLIADLGTGSGVILAFTSAHSKQIFDRSDILGLGIDVNADACIYSGKAVLSNCQQQESKAKYLTTLNTTLFSGIRSGQIDLLIFNPPYVPTPDVPAVQVAEPTTSRDAAYARETHLLSLAYSGGEDGMEVTNKVLAELPHVLSARGVAYILLCKANKVNEVIRRIELWPGKGERIWKAKVVRSSGKQAGWEKLVVLRIWRE